MRSSIGIPRIDPVPTAPAPPIWKQDFGETPCASRTSTSVDLYCSRSGGLHFPGRPQNGNGQSRSQRSPSACTRAQNSHAAEISLCFRNQAGIENAKSSPTIALGVCLQNRTTSSAAASRDLRLTTRRSWPSCASASHSFRPRRLAPDQSIATTAILVLSGYAYTVSGSRAERGRSAAAACPLSAGLLGWLHLPCRKTDHLMAGRLLNRAQILADRREVTTELPCVFHAVVADLVNNWIFHLPDSNSSSGEQISGHSYPAFWTTCRTIMRVKGLLRWVKFHVTRT